MLDKLPVSSILKNVSGSPKTTIGGLVLSLFAGYMMYDNGFDTSYASVEVGVLILGISLFFLSDKKAPTTESEDKKEKGAE